MKNRIIGLIVIGLVLVAAFFLIPSAEESLDLNVAASSDATKSKIVGEFNKAIKSSNSFKSNQFIVKYKANASSQVKNQTIQGITLNTGNKLINRLFPAPTTVRLSNKEQLSSEFTLVEASGSLNNSSYSTILGKLNSNSNIEYAEPNYKIELPKLPESKQTSTDVIETRVVATPDKVYSNQQYRFSFKYSSNYSPTSKIPGAVTGNPINLLNVGGKPSSDYMKLGEGFSVNVIKNVKSFDDYIYLENKEVTKLIRQQSGNANSTIFENYSLFGKNAFFNFIDFNEANRVNRFYTILPTQKVIVNFSFTNKTSENTIKYTLSSFSAEELRNESKITNDPYSYLQWSLNNKYKRYNQANVETGISKAWALEGNNEVQVAIFDDGINSNLKEFADKMWTNQKEIPRNNIDDDNNGFIDDYFGPTNNGDARGSHGNLISSVLAASKNNNYGGAGVCNKCKLIDASTISSTVPETDNAYLIKMFNYVFNNTNAKVMNHSWGTTYYFQSTQDLINKAFARNITIVAAAGSKDSFTQPYVVYPGAYNNVIAVGNINVDGNIINRGQASNYGSFVDLSAPGQYIVSDRGNNIASIQKDGGTSSASPHVAGVAALVYTIKPNATAAQVRDLLVKNTTPFADKSKNQGMGSGILNAEKTLIEAKKLK